MVTLAKWPFQLARWHFQALYNGFAWMTILDRASFSPDSALNRTVSRNFIQYWEFLSSHVINASPIQCYSAIQCFLIRHRKVITVNLIGINFPSPLVSENFNTVSLTRRNKTSFLLCLCYVLLIWLITSFYMHT